MAQHPGPVGGVDYQVEGVDSQVTGVDYQAVFGAAPTPYLLLTPDLVIADANAAYLAVSGRGREELVGRRVVEVFPDDPGNPDADGPRNLAASLRRVLSSAEPDTMGPQRYDAQNKEGTYVERYWSPVNVPVLDAQGRVALVLHRVVELTDLVRAGGGANEPSAGGRCEHPRLGEAEVDLFARARDLQDLNRQLQVARDDLAARALHDPLTGLLVRSVLLEQLAHALARLDRRRGCVGVLFVDLDRLKSVNDTYGHAAGDELIRACATRLQAGVRPSDTVARIGGDEFVVLLDELHPEHGFGEGMTVAQRLLERLDEPCSVAPGVKVRPTASIGIAVTDRGAPAGEGAQEGVSADELLSRADTAMYQAKRGGRGRLGVFDEAAHRAAASRNRAEVDLRAALPGGQLRLHYQPILDLSSGATYAVEALLRWEHPDGRLRTAGEFIDIAQETGLLPQMGAWGISEACRQLAAWDATMGSRAPERMFLNLSTAELSHPRLHRHLAETTAAVGVRPQRLVLEVTETGMLEETTRTTATLDALQGMGCELAIDDFGTGYSSLSRLLQLPAGILKVDRSFVRELHRDQQSVAVLAAVLTLAHNLRKTVVAEGVEDAASLATLQDLGCSYAQGYHLCTPQSAEDLTVFLTSAAPAWVPQR